MTPRTFIAHSDSGPELAITINIAAEIDTPDEITAEHYNVNIPTAQRINADLMQAVNRARIKGAAEMLTQLVCVFVERCKNREARDYGLAFSIGLSQRMNGFRDLAHAARVLNCTRALLSRYKRRFDRLLPPEIRIYGKSAHACEVYTQARLTKLGYREKENNNGNTNKTKTRAHK
jgi:hypothetical protein